MKKYNGNNMQRNKKNKQNKKMFKCSYPLHALHNHIKQFILNACHAKWFFSAFHR